MRLAYRLTALALAVACATAVVVLHGSSIQAPVSGLLLAGIVMAYERASR